MEKHRHKVVIKYLKKKNESTASAVKKKQKKSYTIQAWVIKQRSAMMERPLHKDKSVGGNFKTCFTDDSLAIMKAIIKAA